MIYHSDHLTLLRTASLRPFFHRGKSTLCRVFLDPSPPHLLPRLPTASAYQRAGYREGTISFGAGQVLHVAHLAPGNKTTVAACLTPQKMPAPPTFQMAPNISAGIQPRPGPPPPPSLGTQAHAVPGAWIRGSAPFKILYPARFNCTHVLWVRIRRI